MNIKQLERSQKIYIEIKNKQTKRNKLINSLKKIGVQLS